MRNLPETQFWFVVAGVALSPMLILWIADGIGWSLRHTLWQRPEAALAPQSGREPVREGPAVAAPPGVARSLL